MFEGAKRNWKYVLKAVAMVLVLLVIQYFYELLVNKISTSSLAMILASGILGATLVAISIAIGPIARFWPKYNFIIHRRTIGVLGFILGILHAIFVTAFIFNYDLMGALFAYGFLNPYLNPILFGALTVITLLPSFLTSTDWAIKKLGPQKWKATQNFVFFGIIFLVLHFALTRPDHLTSPLGIILVLSSGAATILELAWFIKMFLKNPKLTNANLLAIATILFGLVLGITALLKNSY